MNDYVSRDESHADGIIKFVFHSGYSAEFVPVIDPSISPNVFGLRESKGPIVAVQ
jgi:hypothetical protein